MIWIPDEIFQILDHLYFLLCTMVLKMWHLPGVQVRVPFQKRTTICYLLNKLVFSPQHYSVISIVWKLLIADEQKDNFQHFLSKYKDERKCHQLHLITNKCDVTVPSKAKLKNRFTSRGGSLDKTKLLIFYFWWKKGVAPMA
jgi:hypothetical protein